ncbi:YdeI/OmpD-associated family protein [Sphingobacterium spiritivorum]|uniref:YdeI/OmpD-associated family protein n=1 Tax=Sphingobacterium spiritivorum TaxID=258 RepID=UPI003DA47A5C
MDKTNRWIEELDLLTQIIQEFPLEQTTKWGGPVFTYQNKNILSFAGFKNHFALWFFNGSHLTDTYQVLRATQGEKTKNLRQWRFTDRSEINSKQIAEYITEAIEVEKKGLKTVPGKKEYIPIPPSLSDQLDNDNVLKHAFEKLSPAKQNEYNEYIAEAKQSKTQATRIEKIIPNILQGYSLHEQYKKPKKV